jgi:hypothetical protein
MVRRICENPKLKRTGTEYLHRHSAGIKVITFDDQSASQRCEYQGLIETGPPLPEFVSGESLKHVLAMPGEINPVSFVYAAKQ